MYSATRTTLKNKLNDKLDGEFRMGRGKKDKSKHRNSRVRKLLQD